MVADMEVDKVADMELDMVADIDINIQLVTVTRQGLPMRPNNNFVRKIHPSKSRET